MNIIIIGAGEVGYNIAEKLSKENKDVILIDKSEDKIKSAKDTLDVQSIVGDGSKPSVLKEAGINKAELLIAVTDSDAINMIACLIAGTQSVVPKKIARIRDPEYVYNTPILGEKHLDIDLAINPEKEAADTILKLLEIPGATDVVEFENGRVKLIGIMVKKESAVIGKALKDLSQLHPEEKVLIASIFRHGKVIVPKGKDVIKEDDLLMAVTVPQNLPGVLKVLGKKDETVKKVMISGGGYVGQYLAQNLEDQGFDIKLIEEDESRCGELTNILSKTIILRGSGTDRALLMEESVDGVDAFISVTKDDEDNILSSLLAKQLGAKRVFTFVNKISYMPIVSTIGVDVAVSPRISAISKILQYIRKGKILSVATLRDEEVEVIEFVALETSEIIGKKLKKIDFPDEAIVGAIIRGDEIIIPKGNDEILSGDKLIICAKKDTIPKIEKILAVKLEYF